MADVITGLFDFTLPEVGGSDDTWGDKLSANWAKMETLLAGVFPGGLPTALGGRLVLTGTGPVLEFTETDAVSPAGRHRFVSGAGGAGRFALQKAAADGTYTGATDIWSLPSDGSALAFGIPITGGSATFGAIEINVQAGYIRRTTGTIVYDVPTAGIHSFRINNVDAARVEPAGPTFASALAIITGEKGDARYARLDGSNNFSSMSIESSTPALDFHETDAPGTGGGRFRFVGFATGQFALQGTATEDWSSQFHIWRYLSGNLQVEVPLITTATLNVGGVLSIKPSNVTFLTLDATNAASSAYDINLVGSADASSSALRLGRSSPAGNVSFYLLNPGTTTIRVALDSAGTGKVTAGVGDFGDYLIGAAAAGTVDTTLISAKTGSPFNIRTGLNTGVLARVQQANATTAAAFDPLGTAVSGAVSVITREKGDLRYAAKTVLLVALAALNSGMTPVDLRDAIVGALNAPVPA